MVQQLIRQSASIADLKRLAKRRIPKFAFDYIEGGCNSENTVKQNRLSLDDTTLRPDYIKSYQAPDLATTLLGQSYAMPLGISPLGLTGIVWPHASVMHAKAAKKANIPFILSTVSTTSIEDAAAAAEDNFWFQLYPPSDLTIRANLLKRAKAVGCKNLVVTVDVPSPSRRPRDIRSGLAIPPKITVKSVLQSVIRPAWSIATLKAGLPQFASLVPYLEGLDKIEDVANFVRMALREPVDGDMLSKLRDDWQGNLIIKGINHVDDAKAVAALGADGIIVSNHGGRQLDAALGTATVLPDIAKAVGNDITVMVDSGVESGVDIARFLALGADTVFAGRAFLYGVAAHQQQGAEHAIDLLRDELWQVLSQVHCESASDMPHHLI